MHDKAFNNRRDKNSNQCAKRPNSVKRKVFKYKRWRHPGTKPGQLFVCCSRRILHFIFRAVCILTKKYRLLNVRETSLPTLSGSENNGTGIVVLAMNSARLKDAIYMIRAIIKMYKQGRYAL